GGSTSRERSPRSPPRRWFPLRSRFGFRATTEGSLLTDPARSRELASSLGRVGVWTFAFDSQPPDAIRAASREVESLGFSALWIPEGMGSREVFSHLSLLLASTERLRCCSGILNVGMRDPIAAALGARTLAEAYPGRVAIGMGIGHSYQAEIRGVTYSKPVAR